MLFFSRQCPLHCWLVISLTLLTPSLGRTAYKWVDKEGIIHYSQLPPLNQEAQKIILPALADTPALMPEFLQKRLQSLQQEQHEREKTAAEKTYIQRCLAACKHSCEVARENLKLFKETPAYRRQSGKLYPFKLG